MIPGNWWVDTYHLKIEFNFWKTGWIPEVLVRDCGFLFGQKYRPSTAMQLVSCRQGPEAYDNYEMAFILPTVHLVKLVAVPGQQTQY